MKLSYNKRLAVWLLLVTLLTVGFCVAAEQYIDKGSKYLLAELTVLPEQIEDGEWAQAEAMLDESYGDWQNCRRIWLGLLSHQEVWNIDTAFISLSSFLKEEKRDDALNQLSLLAYYIERVKDSDTVTWRNFF